MKKKLVIGTRKSKLALWQANHITELIQARYPELEIELKHIVTTGDRILDVPLAKIGGKGLFTKEIEHAILEHKIDLAVHSLKDMPTEFAEGLVLAAITDRLDPGDALISPKYQTIDNLPIGACVGTSSLRRKSQLLNYRPDLKIVDLRGNLDTRLEKLKNGDFDAIILAVAGLKRLGWEEQITQVIPKNICLPAVGQGALAIEARSGDNEVLEMISFLDHHQTRCAVTAERAYLKVIEGGCQVPVGVYGEVEDDKLRLTATIVSLDGTKMIREVLEGNTTEAKIMGVDLAKRMLAAGGQEILEQIM